MKILFAFWFCIFSIVLSSQETSEELNIQGSDLEGVWEVFGTDWRTDTGTVFYYSDPGFTTYYCFEKHLWEIAVISFSKDASRPFSIEFMDGIEFWDDSLSENYLHPAFVKYWGEYPGCEYEGIGTCMNVTYCSDSVVKLSELWYWDDSVIWARQFHLKRVRKHFTKTPYDLNEFYGMWNAKAMAAYSGQDSVMELQSDLRFVIKLDSLKLEYSGESFYSYRNRKSNILNYQSIDFLGQAILIMETEPALYLYLHPADHDHIWVSFMNFGCGISGTYFFERKDE